MGSGASAHRTKTIFLEINGKEISVLFSPQCGSRELKDLLTSAAGLSRLATITLTNVEGSLVAISPSMPPNTPRTRYKLHYIRATEAADQEAFHDILSKVGEEFTKAFKIHEFTAEFSSKLEAVEKRLEVEGIKAVEIDKCKCELQKLQSQLMSDSAKRHSLEFESRRAQATPPRDPSLYPKYVLTQETVQYLKKPTFNIWHWEPNEMLCLLEHMYNQLGLVSELHINPVTLRKWLLKIQENYHDNPYHNFRHCFCVVQMMYGMIHLCNLEATLTKLEVAVLITAAICHDLDHPGFNNNYQINAQTELALRYNDISPLENHHCAVAFQILEKPETNIFANVSVEDFKKIRAGMIELILATDMARHTELMQQFSSTLEQGFDYNNEEHRRTLQIMLIKSCDISNEVRPMEVSAPWVDCLLEEYFLQSDREKLEGLPVAAFMDRDKVTKPSAQIGFIKFVLMPLFESMSKLYPQLECAMLRPLRSSLEHYEQLKAMEDMLREEEPDNAAKAKLTSLKRGAGSQVTKPKEDFMIAVPLTAVKPRSGHRASRVK